MELNSTQRESLSGVFEHYLNQAGPSSWTTLWHHPSVREPEIIRLIAVTDHPGIVRGLAKVKNELEDRMKVGSGSTRLFLEIVPTSEFHLRYQSQTGYELIREWNGDSVESGRRFSVLRWLRYKRHGNLLLPILVAAMLVMLVRIFAQHAF